MILTDWFILGVILLIVIVDIVLVVTHEPTVSNRMRRLGRGLSAAPYGWGVLGGHFWGPGLGPLYESWWISIGLLLFLAAVLTVGHLLLRKWTSVPSWAALIYIPLGILAGIFLWPQG